jgi:hypothetical protein
MKKPLPMYFNTLSASLVYKNEKSQRVLRRLSQK